MRRFYLLFFHLFCHILIQYKKKFIYNFQKSIKKSFNLFKYLTNSYTVFCMLLSASHQTRTRKFEINFNVLNFIRRRFMASVAATYVVVLLNCHHHRHHHHMVVIHTSLCEWNFFSNSSRLAFVVA